MKTLRSGEQFVEKNICVLSNTNLQLGLLGDVTDRSYMAPKGDMAHANYMCQNRLRTTCIAYVCVHRLGLLKYNNIATEQSLCVQT